MYILHMTVHVLITTYVRTGKVAADASITLKNTQQKQLEKRTTSTALLSYHTHNNKQTQARRLQVHIYICSRHPATRKKRHDTTNIPDKKQNPSARVCVRKMYTYRRILHCCLLATMNGASLSRRRRSLVHRPGKIYLISPT